MNVSRCTFQVNDSGFQSSFPIWVGKNYSRITRSVASYHIPVDKSIYFSKDATCRKTASIGTSDWLGMWGSVIFPHHLVFLKVRLIKLNADIIGATTLTCVRPWKVAVLSRIPLGGNIVFDLLSWLEGMSIFMGFHLDFFTTRVLTLEAKEPMYRLCQILSFSKCFHGPSRPIVNQI